MNPKGREERSLFRNSASGMNEDYSFDGHPASNMFPFSENPYGNLNQNNSN